MKLVVVSTYPPRRCGLAQFTSDLRGALGALVPPRQVGVCAIDRDGLSYGPEVVEVIRQDSPDDYDRAARGLAAWGADVVVIQHEYGIFGGPDGAYIVDLAQRLHWLGVPYVVTLHTVLSHPSPGQAATLAALCSSAARVTGFTSTARDLATATGVAEASRFAVVPHGAPEVLRAPTNPGEALRPAVRETLACLGPARMLATFGLIGPSKGLETAIRALPAVLRGHPDVQYVIVGATHPDVARCGDESYRAGLVALVERLGLAGHIRFIPAFLTELELAALLAHTEIYLTPYRSREQICSGALTFALAAGVPVVSTAYPYAVDMVTPPGQPANGLLVGFDDPQALAAAVVAMLDDPDRLAATRRSVRAFGAGLLWPSVAQRFATVFARAARAPRMLMVPAKAPMHLATLTDEIGIIQFARGTTPDPDSGYCVDDAARLAIVAATLATPAKATGERISGVDGAPARWLTAALRLLEAALRIEGMHNLLGYDGVWLDRPYLGDHVGRTCWAVGVVAGRPLPPDVRGRARLLLDAVLPLVTRLTAPRSRAYAILGLARLDEPSAGVAEALRDAAGHLAAAVRRDRDWHWFEPDLTYDNARLPQALLAAGDHLGDPAMTALGLSTLDWYLGQVGLAQDGAVLRLVGNRWRHRGTPPGDEGDEQPLDAAATVEALVEAYRITGHLRYAGQARRAFRWFHGLNQAGVAVYDPATGGSRDGLSGASASLNQGAESTLAYYQALLALADAGLIHAARRQAITLIARGLCDRRSPRVAGKEQR